MPERRAVVEGLAPGLRPARVEVRIDVNHCERPVPLREPPQQGQGHRVVAADHEGGRSRGSHPRCRLLDRLPHGRRAERREGHVAAVHRRKGGEDLALVHGVVALQERRDTPHLPGREPGPGLVGGAEVRGDSEQHRARARPHRAHRQGKPEERDLPVAQVGQGVFLRHAAPSMRRVRVRTRAASASASDVA